jgi:uncharacterized oxidoreductase
MSLSGQTVLITGGGSGIGLALAKALAQKNNRVIICGRDPRKLEEALQRLPQLIALPCDVSDEQSLLALRRRLESDNLHPSILVNNAAIQLHTNFLSTPESELFVKLEQELATNFTGLVKLTTLLLPMLQHGGSGRIINLTSGLALTPKAGAPVYCATKAAVRAFGTALRYQLEDAGSRVRLTEVILPLVDTAMTQGRGSANLKISPEAVAAAILAQLPRNPSEIYLGRAKLLWLLHRFLPSVAARIMRNGL